MHIGTDMQTYEHSRGRESMVRETEKMNLESLRSKNIYQRAMRPLSLIFFIKRFCRVGVWYSCLRWWVLNIVAIQTVTLNENVMVIWRMTNIIVTGSSQIT